MLYKEIQDLLDTYRSGSLPIHATHTLDGIRYSPLFPYITSIIFGDE